MSNDKADEKSARHRQSSDDELLNRTELGERKRYEGHVDSPSGYFVIVRVLESQGHAFEPFTLVFDELIVLDRTRLCLVWQQNEKERIAGDAGSPLVIVDDLLCDSLFLYV